MSIDEYIKRMGDIRRNYDRWSGLLTPNEVKAFDMTMVIANKYQRIQAIVEAWKADTDIDSYDSMTDIYEVVEDGTN